MLLVVLDLPVALAQTNLTTTSTLTPPGYITSPSGDFAFAFRALTLTPTSFFSQSGSTSMRPVLPSRRWCRTPRSPISARRCDRDEAVRPWPYGWQALPRRLQWQQHPVGELERQKQVQQPCRAPGHWQPAARCTWRQQHLVGELPATHRHPPPGPVQGLRDEPAVQALRHGLLRRPLRPVRASGPQRRLVLHGAPGQQTTWTRTMRTGRPTPTTRATPRTATPRSSSTPTCLGTSTTGSRTARCAT